jgi:acyl-lipid omega-6 desaturase (Delta-12 desaturase)
VKNANPTIASTDWKAIVSKYAGPDVRVSLWQLFSTLFLLFSAVYIAFWLMDYAWWASALMVIPIAGLQTRTFIFMHDCAHGSFLPWPKANDAVGFITGVLTFTPYQAWRREHAIHHASSGDLDRRGWGDVTTLTVAEYQALSRWGKIKYRVYRNPIVLFGVGPLHLMVLQRFRFMPSEAAGAKQLWNIWMTNAAMVGLAIIAYMVLDWRSVWLLYVPGFYVAGAVGIWLFYVQHQFEEAYWERNKTWDYATAAITGSTHLKLPAVLNWFTGHIGLHHVHHLGPKIPNYKLKKAHEENPVFQEAPVITLKTAWKSLRLALWDEERGRMVGFRELRTN